MVGRILGQARLFSPPHRFLCVLSSGSIVFHVENTGACLISACTVRLKRVLLAHSDVLGSGRSYGPLQFRGALCPGLVRERQVAVFPVAEEARHTMGR